MTKDDKVVARTMTLYPMHWAAIDSYAAKMGYPSTSAALRRIIDEWRTVKAELSPGTDATHSSVVYL